jgi:hypothetical protein
MRTEGAALSAASQWDGRDTSCRFKHESEYTAGDRSATDTAAVVNAGDDYAADDATAGNAAADG